jgi:hypothetical protein
MSENGDDEINVEGEAAVHAASFPYHNPQGCRDILFALSKMVELGLENRASRLGRDNPES